MIKVLKSHFDLLRIMLNRDLKALYIHNLLGLMWVVLNPLFVVLLYSFVFSVILKIRGQGYDAQYSYAVFLLAGMIPYLAINDVIQASASCLQQKKDLIIKAVFPAELLPINCVIISIISEGITLLLVLCLALYENGWHFHAMWLVLPLLVILRLMFSLAIAWWVSILTVFVPDLRQVLNAVLPAWMFLTPILYAKEQAPSYFQEIQNFNPLFHIVDAYRAIILQTSWPETSLWISFAVLLIVNVLGYWLFKALISRAKDFL